ncbi:MAG: tRNA (adenosine(37)-N6)-threonylcarbamoyltransferase complex dimerization subunit type 1 TsaB, partial [Spirochaetales bacterium]|nr:tRNA (adenosine(37)-N6)-threonylcarbamoyltransferase complex dimerization subunit type 1 TsaB [Spirochaetales bacterium]
MNILNIDTATEVFGLGLSTSCGESYDMVKNIGLKHAEIGMPAIKSLLDEAGISLSDLQLIVCAGGPGSFTGLRIGMATAKGLSAGAGVPVVSIPTLDAMAYGLDWFEGLVLPVIDARKKRIYVAEYRRGVRESDYLDLPIEFLPEIAAKEQALLLTGTAPELAQEVFGASDTNNLKTISIYRRLGWNECY